MSDYLPSAAVLHAAEEWRNMVMRLLRAALVGGLVLGCSACEQYPPGPEYPELNPGAINVYPSPGVDVRFGGADIWGGGWGPIATQHGPLWPR